MKKNKKTFHPKDLRQTSRRHFKMVFLPHAANQFRPHAVRRYSLFAALLFVVVTQVMYSFVASNVALGAPRAITSQELLKHTNAERKLHGAVPLKLNEELSRAAALKAKDMAVRHYWAHVGPDGATPWYWLEKAGYGYKVAGENLARGFGSAPGVVTAWMSSPDHRKNMLNKNYEDVGFATMQGTFKGQLTTLTVAFYGQPREGSAGLGPVAVSKPQMLTPTARFSVALQTMTPWALVSLGILGILILVALMAHIYRDKLPRCLRASWYRHHGLLKAGGMLSLAAVIIILYSGGQI